jgi:hypothetical protein
MGQTREFINESYVSQKILQIKIANNIEANKNNKVTDDFVQFSQR